MAESEAIKMTENECVGIAGGVTNSARDAAETWARSHFTPGRRIENLELMPEDLSMKFSLMNGSRRYLAKWNDPLQRYCITVIT